MPVLTVVRHGPTALNGQRKLRGWLNPELTPGGIALAKALQLPPVPMYSSDLLRATQTALQTGRKFKLAPALRPWNVGSFAGTDADDAHRRLKWYIAHPDQRVPFGEPYQQFQDRLLSFAASIREDTVLVTHFRCCKLLKAWEAGKFVSVDASVLLSDDIELLSTVAIVIP